MYYVTMTDKFLSGWGEAENKINKLVFECLSEHDADIVIDNAKARNDMKDINVTKHKPKYDSARYLVQFKTENDYPNWYQEGYFRKEEK